MTDTITISKDEYEKLKADAERYRWLRVSDNKQLELMQIHYGDELDQAIDEARKHHAV